MNEKNPYENDDTVDIPDFSSIKVKDEDIEHSVFKTNNFSSTVEENDDEYEEEDEDENGSHNIKKTGLILMMSIIVLLLILSIFGIAWGISKNKAYTALKSEYDEYVTKAQTNEKELNDKILELQNQLSNNSNNNTEIQGETTYKITATGPVNIRTGAGKSNNQTLFNDLSSKLQEIATKNDEGNALIDPGQKFTALESKEDSDGNTWAKLDDNAWVCINFNGEVLASKA